MISSTPKRSAVRKGERTAFRRSTISRAQRRRVLGRLELAAVGRLDAALDRQRAPVARGPGVAQVQARVVAVRGAGHAEHLAHEDRHRGHRSPGRPRTSRACRAGSCRAARPRCRSRSRAGPRSSRAAGGTGRTGPRSGWASPRRRRSARRRSAWGREAITPTGRPPRRAERGDERAPERARPSRTPSPRSNTSSSDAARRRRAARRRAGTIESSSSSRRSAGSEPRPTGGASHTLPGR